MSVQENQQLKYKPALDNSKPSGEQYQTHLLPPNNQQSDQQGLFLPPHTYTLVNTLSLKMKITLYILMGFMALWIALVVASLASKRFFEWKIKVIQNDQSYFQQDNDVSKPNNDIIGGLNQFQSGSGIFQLLENQKYKDVFEAMNCKNHAEKTIFCHAINSFQKSGDIFTFFFAISVILLVVWILVTFRVTRDNKNNIDYYQFTRNQNLCVSIVIIIYLIFGVFGFYLVAPIGVNCDQQSNQIIKDCYDKEFNDWECHGQMCISDGVNLGFAALILVFITAVISWAINSRIYRQKYQIHLEMKEQEKENEYQKLLARLKADIFDGTTSVQKIDIQLSQLSDQLRHQQDQFPSDPKQPDNQKNKLL